MERVVSEHVAGAADGVFDGYVVFRYHDINAALLGELVQRRCKAAAGRIAEAAYVGLSIQHACDQVVQGCGIAFEREEREGLDAPGSTLKGVVIPRLPFSSPNDPLSKERAAREKGAWSKT